MASTISAGLTTTTSLSFSGDTSGVLQLQTNGTTTAVTIDTSQNVGIGTTSPSTKLNIVQNQNGASQVLISNNTGGASSQVLFSATDGTNYGQFGMWGSGVSASGAQQPSNAFVYGSGGISYFTGGTHRWYYSTNTEGMRLDTNGRLGIAITPVTTSGISLEMGGASDFNSINFNNTASYQGWIVTNAYWNGTNWINIRGGGTTSTAFASNYQGTFRWYVGSSGSSGGTLTSFNPSSGTPNMILDATGNLLVGTTSQFNGGKVCVLFDGSVGNGLDLKTSYSSTGSQFIDFRNSSGTQIGYITQNGSTTINYVNSSDARLKTLIGVATDTSVIDNIVVNDFTWKTDGTTDRGVFAQDAYNVKPSAVSKGKDDVLDEKGLPLNPWGVDYSKFVPDLIVYCQQLKKQVTELSAQVTTLQSQVAALKA
jgi:hypothetical protein